MNNNIFTDNWVSSQQFKCDLNHLEVGCSVKLNNNGERFFVEVIHIAADGSIYGIVSNILLYDKPYKNGDTICFRKEHIWQLYHKQYMQEMQPYVQQIIEYLLGQGKSEKEVAIILSTYTARN